MAARLRPGPGHAAGPLPVRPGSHSAPQRQWAPPNSVHRSCGGCAVAAPSATPHSEPPSLRFPPLLSPGSFPARGALVCRGATGAGEAAVGATENATEGTPSRRVAEPAGGPESGEFSGASATEAGQGQAQAEGGAQARGTGQAGEGVDFSKMVEVGVVLGPHGLRGDVRVKVLTDFPEQRLGQAGWKVLRLPGLARKTERLWSTRGRLGPGKGAPWLLHFRGISTLEEAARLQGSVILAQGSERPELEEGEVYSADLIGLRVLLLESGEEVGVVEDVFSTGGAGELLRVRLTSLAASQSSPSPTASAAAAETAGDAEFAAAGSSVGVDAEGEEDDEEGESRKEAAEDEMKKDGEQEEGPAGPSAEGRQGGSPDTRRVGREVQRVWVPFVKEIVPVLDINGGFLQISPPAGLLDLNVSEGGTGSRGEGKKKSKQRRRR